METTQTNKLNTLITALKSNPPNYSEPTSVKSWFLHNSIRVSYPEEGDATSLWFCLADIARVIEDQNYARYKSKYIHKVKMNDRNGRSQTYTMLTEQGLYHYLLRSKRPAAEPFQDWVCGLLINIRREVVSKTERDLSAAQLKAKVDNRNILVDAMLLSDRELQCVYFVRSGEYTKIGYTNNLTKRLQCLQTGNPIQLILIYSTLTRYGKQLETDLHMMFADYSIRNEWFKLPDDFMDRIVNLCT